ncbi:MAG: Shikimate dehydrogenase substrate binding domain protein [Limisphaerales bacterium]|nr:MAG: Shikimate dehydrogenase substrate binding domain protein [Limisphaerales bacterium]KAG0508264.1 MAG: Shikimate dehydrogenase substrate binding domain protein [Limisphaerales bacterium]TXT49579.1 MAG: Shikimate dehydrogenase substrate binding domain protein [Limisphaerales bacterium]
MHNPALAALGLDWRYLACDVHPDRLREAIAGAQAMKFIGLNLTVPHKLLAVDIVDELDESAKTWGAVNTVRFEAKDKSGAWQPLAKLNPDDIGELRSHGFNTDADAITRSLRMDLGVQPLVDARVLLLGAGGAGRAAALKLASEPVAELFLVNRTQSKADEIAAQITKAQVEGRFPFTKVTVGYPAGTVDLILNATSLGLRPGDALPLDEKHFPLTKATYVYDMIYRPAETPLLRAAKAAGCKVANGLGMLLYQGTKALEIWTGQPAPVELMRAALLKNVYARA